MVLGIDSIANAWTPRSLSRSIPARVGQRLEESDQNLTAAKSLCFGVARLADLDDRLRLPDVVGERRPGFLIRGVRKRGGNAGAALDQDFEPAAGELRNGLGDESHSALALLELTRDAD